MRQIEFKDMMQTMMQLPKDVRSIHSATHCRHTSVLPKDRWHVRNIIDSMINIQATLARHYAYKRTFGLTRSSDSVYWLTNDIEREIEMFVSIFDEVIVSKAPDGTPFDVQVSHANALAYEVFAEMIVENRVDEYIRHLTIERPFIQDLCQNSYFEIDRCESEIVKNRYYDYLMSGSASPYMLNPLGIDVSGFHIEEIENDDYVQRLAARVKHLYLMVF
ncbi:MAG: hypothetical protein ACYCVB_16375, partial [Bacilli bacterium]